jgi:YD repeat-containing protein
MTIAGARQIFSSASVLAVWISIGRFTTKTMGGAAVYLVTRNLPSLAKWRQRSFLDLDAGAVRRTDATDRSTTEFLDDRNFVVQLSRAGGTAQQNIFNVADSAIQTIVPGIAATTVHYDAQHRVIGVVDAAGHGYDATYETNFGNLSS